MSYAPRHYRKTVDRVIGLPDPSVSHSFSRGRLIGLNVPSIATNDSALPGPNAIRMSEFNSVQGFSTSSRMTMIVFSKSKMFTSLLMYITFQGSGKYVDGFFSSICASVTVTVGDYSVQLYSLYSIRQAGVSSCTLSCKLHSSRVRREDI